MKRYEKEHYQDEIDNFCSAICLADIASILGLKSKSLGYILHKLKGGRDYQYSDFSIPKKSGGVRTISAPSPALKEVQRRLNELLLKVYWERPCVHSFLHKRSIVTNAQKHTGMRYVFNIDLKDFFPSINFGRVRGLFVAKPYKLHPDAATVVAQIACYKNSLPQGSPSSPIISNMICSKLDKQLMGLAKANKCHYTRYADDITFSTNQKKFPSDIGCIIDGIAYAGEELCIVVKNNGFLINHNKTNLQTDLMRQEVTGLIVNKFCNVRRSLIEQVRAMLYSWEKFGYAAAEAEHHSKYLNLPPGDPGPSYRNIVRGKIEFIRMVRDEKRRSDNKRDPNRNNVVFNTLLPKFFECSLRDSDKTIIRTEGHTDWYHLAAALNYLRGKGKFSTLDVNFLKLNDKYCYGNNILLKFCYKSKKLNPFSNKIICVFDSDDKNVNGIHKNKEWVYWGNNVYSFVLPGIKGVSDSVCIEMYHYKKYMQITDANGRRIFLNSEFDENGRHRVNKNIKYGYDPIQKKKIPSWRDNLKGGLKIIDNGVFRYSSSRPYSLALSKSRFAKNIFYKEPGFDTVNFSRFSTVFKIIEKIESLS